MDVTLTPWQEKLRAEARVFAAERVRPAIEQMEWLPDPRDRIAWDLVEEADAYGWRTLGVPREYGGPEHGASALDFCLLIEELAVGDMGFSVLIDQTIKVSRLIAHIATPEQHERFWPEFVANPRYTLAAAMTEPAHGSDGFLPYRNYHYDTTAVRDGDGWILNGKKRYISNGADAGMYIIYACTDPSVPSDRGTTAFMLPAGTPGFEVTHIWEKISQRGINNATLEFTDVRIPDADRLGPVGGALPTLRGLGKESAIEAGITTIGSARAALEAAHAHVKTRVQGGKPLIEHSSVAMRLGWMAARLEAARSMVWRVAKMIDDEGEALDPIYSSMTKVFCADVAFAVARDACELFGGAGIMIGSSVVEKTLRDTLSFLHSDGTQEVHMIKVGNLFAERDSVAPPIAQPAAA